MEKTSYIMCFVNDYGLELFLDISKKVQKNLENQLNVFGPGRTLEQKLLFESDCTNGLLLSNRSIHVSKQATTEMTFTMQRRIHQEF